MDIIVKTNPNLANGNFMPPSVKKAIVMRGENLIKSYFRDGGNFREKWKSVKRGGQPLLDTGRLRDNVVGQVVGGQMQIINKINYARIHNFGGVINHPGGTPYAVIGRKSVFLKKDGQYPPNTKFTKPHKITIPKREFMILPDGWATKVAIEEMLDYNDWINKK